MYRNHTRALLVVGVLGLSVGLFVTMSRTGAATSSEARELKARAATQVEVNEAGNTSGYAGQVTAKLLPADVRHLRALRHVVKVERYVKRQFVDNRRTPPTGVLIGVDPGATLRLQSMGGFVGSPRLLAGRGFTPADAGKPVAIVGAAFARSRGVGLGDEFVLPGAEVQRGKWIFPHPIQDLRARVVGLFEVRVVYPDNQVFVPLDVAQRAMGLGPERVSQYIVTVDSGENVPTVARAIKAALGPDVDVISQDQAALQATGALETVSRTSRVGGLVAAIVGALVVLFTMALVTRERTREIGILKAIGASNRNVAYLFTAEALALAAFAALLGSLLYAVAGRVLGAIFLGVVGAQVARGVRDGLDLGALAQGLVVAVGFGLLGSLYAVTRAVRLKPSDAMRER